MIFQAHLGKVYAIPLYIKYIYLKIRAYFACEWHDLRYSSTVMPQCMNENMTTIVFQSTSRPITAQFSNNNLGWIHMVSSCGTQALNINDLYIDQTIANMTWWSRVVSASLWNWWNFTSCWSLIGSHEILWILYNKSNLRDLKAATGL